MSKSLAIVCAPHILFANYRMAIHAVAVANLQISDFFWKPENVVKIIL